MMVNKKFLRVAITFTGFGMYVAGYPIGLLLLGFGAGLSFSALDNHDCSTK